MALTANSAHAHKYNVTMLNCLLGHSPIVAYWAGNIAYALQTKQNVNIWHKFFVNNYYASFKWCYSRNAWLLAQWARNNGVFNMFK